MKARRCAAETVGAELHRELWSGEMGGDALTYSVMEKEKIQTQLSDKNPLFSPKTKNRADEN